MTGSISALRERNFTVANPLRANPLRLPGHTVGARVADAAPWAVHYRRRLISTDVLVVVATSVGALALPSPHAIAFCVLLIALWLVALSAYRSRGANVLGGGTCEYKQVVAASVLTFGLLAVAGLILDPGGLRVFFLIALPAGTTALVVSRWLWRRWLVRQRAEGLYLSKAVIVGSVSDVIDIATRIEKSSGAAYTVVGAILDGYESRSIDTGSRSLPVLAGLDSIAAAVRAAGAETVIVAGQHSGDPDFVRELRWSLEPTAAELVLAAALTDVAGPRIHVRPVDGIPLVHVDLPTFTGGKHLIKRSFDVALAGVALIVLAPVLAIIALAVLSDRSGPILFRQKRVGKDGRTFRMLKFRSMVDTAEQDLHALLDRNQGAGVLFKLTNDPRVTRVGAFLRKYSLDELPQLWNIIVGDMSIVGPRPPLPREVRRYEDHVSRRLYIKPGLTGLWQISGRSDLSWEESVRLDLYYVENWSLLGDLWIMWRTLKVVVKPSGAY